ncbi:MAG: hypothetical protein LPK02_07275 [Rhodobacterales bacterium]|mgnify:CR=1 FL=1|nr:hypothetical protein [Rhodobacterales bacterium]
MTETKDTFDAAAVEIPKGLRLRKDERWRIAQELAKQRRAEYDAKLPTEWVLNLHKRLMAYLWNVPTFEEAIERVNALHPALVSSTTRLEIRTATEVERDGNTKLHWVRSSLLLGTHSSEALDPAIKFFVPFDQYRNVIVPHYGRDYAKSQVGEAHADKVVELGHYNGSIFMNPDDNLAQDLMAYIDRDARLESGFLDLQNSIRVLLNSIKNAEQLRELLPEGFAIHYRLYQHRYEGAEEVNLPAVSAKHSAEAIRKALEDFPDQAAA